MVYAVGIMKKENKPCPFCGSKNIFLEVLLGRQLRRIRCSDCEACGPVDEIADEAVEKWNKRSGDTCL